MRTGIGPKPDTARATFTMVIWLAGPWADWDFAVSISRAEHISAAASPAGMMSEVPPKDSLGAVLRGW